MKKQMKTFVRHESVWYMHSLTYISDSFCQAQLMIIDVLHFQTLRNERLSKIHIIAVGGMTSMQISGAVCNIYEI